jgi:heme oxygenase
MEELRVLARLNEETQIHHTEADLDVDRYLFCPNVSAADYKTYLQRVYGFLVPLEAALASAPDLDSIIDVRERSKSALLAHDLFVLGMTMDEISALPHCNRVPTFRGPAAALGWMYVVERPILASAVIRGHLAAYLPTEMSTASAYFMCYAGQVGGMWRELGLAMEQVAGTPAIADRIVVAAHEAFRTLHRWRSQDLGRTNVIRFAG